MKIDPHHPFYHILSLREKSPNTGKYGSEKTPYLDIFRAVSIILHSDKVLISVLSDRLFFRVPSNRFFYQVISAVFPVRHSFFIKICYYFFIGSKFLVLKIIIFSKRSSHLTIILTCFDKFNKTVSEKKKKYLHERDAEYYIANKFHKFLVVIYCMKIV